MGDRRSVVVHFLDVRGAEQLGRRRGLSLLLRDRRREDGSLERRGGQCIGGSSAYVVEVVPEPATAVVLGLGFFATARRRKGA